MGSSYYYCPECDVVIWPKGMSHELKMCGGVLVDLLQYYKDNKDEMRCDFDCDNCHPDDCDCWQCRSDGYIDDGDDDDDDDDDDATYGQVVWKDGEPTVVSLTRLKDILPDGPDDGFLEAAARALERYVRESHSG